MNGLEILGLAFLVCGYVVLGITVLADRYDLSRERAINRIDRLEKKQAVVDTKKAIKKATARGNSTRNGTGVRK